MHFHGGNPRFGYSLIRRWQHFVSYFPVGGTVLELIWFNGLVVALVVGDDLCGSDSEIERGQGERIVWAPRGGVNRCYTKF